MNALRWQILKVARWIPGTQAWRIRRAMANLAMQLEFLASRPESADDK